MTLLTYVYKGQTYSVDLPVEKGISISLSIEGEHEWHFNKDKTIHEYPIQIMRADNGFYAIIASREANVRVNKFPVLGQHVLRNADCVQIGQEEIRFYEWVRLTMTYDSRPFNAECPFCTLPFQIADLLMLCPKCDTAMHDACWVSRKEVGEGCIVPNCGYFPPEEDPYIPVRST